VQKKLKVALICHFRNKEIDQELNLRKTRNEMAPWITGLIKLFQNKKEIELHVISPYDYLGKQVSFEKNGIHYHFYNCGIPIYGRHWPRFFIFDYWTNFIFNKRKVRKIVKEIQPDIIHLYGAENAYYSSTIFQFKNEYPVIVTIQGFISRATEKKHYQTIKRIKTEEKIIKEFRHFGCNTNKIGQYIKKYNPGAILYWHRFPVSVEVTPHPAKKRYDFVFFARVTKDKGVEDLLEALALIKKEKGDVTLIVIGDGSIGYLGYLKKKCEDYDISNNVSWAGFLMQRNAQRLVSASRISVLPTYNDQIPGTIIESMFLKTPVIAYGVGGIPEINIKGEVIRIVEKKNIEKLAKEMLSLLKSKEQRKSMAEAAYKRVSEMFDNSQVYPDLLKAYRSVISNQPNI